MKITFLGTGTSTGVPVLGCNCEVCRSEDTRDKRLRTSALIETRGKTILIDCGPDLRQQLLRAKVTKIDAVLITHFHYDHVAGLDDIRPFGEVPVYAEQNVLEQLKTTMPYCFSEKKYPGIPKIELCEISEKPFWLEDIEIQTIRVLHGSMPIFGYRINNVAYITDAKTICATEMNKLEKLDLLILNALRHQEHFAHFNIQEAIAKAQELRAKQTYFVHFAHTIGKHADIQPVLPENIFLAYDGLELQI
ncbi:MAG: MBL fold metallo-hydrolase [Paludibacter sp.]|nr:MBL fold metallo-hydrolase [Paludibacter sp.]